MRNSDSTIPEHEQPRVVERFYRGERARRIPGTGMGLAIVRQIAQAHGGSLTVASSVELGHGVRHLLPTRRVDGMSAGRILVVDDDPQIRRVMRVTLTGQGYEIADSKSGEEALDTLRAERFDLVLLDMNMPGMGGIECCRLIRVAFRNRRHHADRARQRVRQSGGARRGRR